MKYQNSFKTQWRGSYKNQTHGIDPDLIDSYAKEIKKVFDQGIEIAIVMAEETSSGESRLAKEWIEYKQIIWEC